MKTVLSGTHQPDQPQPKRTRRSPKKRRNEKSEVATPEFGTISSAKPSHGEPTRTTDSSAKATGDRNVPYTEYHRELRKARNRRNDYIHMRVREAETVGMAIGIVIGLITGLGVWWLSSLFS